MPKLVPALMQKLVWSRRDRKRGRGGINVSETSPPPDGFSSFSTISGSAKLTHDDFFSFLALLDILSEIMTLYEAQLMSNR